MTAEWPVELRGVTESVVTTLGPNDRWNVAALGLYAPDAVPPTVDDPVTARTWGRTRTRRNFEERGEGFVQFTVDPLLFVEAALSVTERSEPVLDDAAAVVEVEVDRYDAGEDGGTEWIDWTLTPVETTVWETTVPTTNRGYNAVIDATVAASRLDVPAYDTDELLDRLRYFESVVDAAGGPREREAFDRLADLVDVDW